MLNAFKWCLIIIGAVTLLFFSIGMLATAFHTEPITDKVEEALEEVTRKRGKRK